MKSKSKINKERGDYPIPFDEDGNLLNFVYDEEYAPGRIKIFWRDNFDCFKLVKFVRFDKGRSSATAIVESNGNEFPITLHDFAPIVPRMAEGHYYGKFTFVKKGKNYSMKLAQEKEIVPQ